MGDSQNLAQAEKHCYDISDLLLHSTLRVIAVEEQMLHARRISRSISLSQIQMANEELHCLLFFDRIKADATTTSSRHLMTIRSRAFHCLGRSRYSNYWTPRFCQHAKR